MSWGWVGAGTAGSRTWVAVQSREPGKTYCEVTYRSSDLSWAAPPYAYACGCVLAYADKRLTIFNTYAHPTDLPIAHLRGQYPMTAAHSPAKWGADSRGDDDVVCRVEEGGKQRGKRGKQDVAAQYRILPVCYSTISYYNVVPFHKVQRWYHSMVPYITAQHRILQCITIP